MMLSLASVWLLLQVFNLCLSFDGWQRKAFKPADQCFCQLSGKIDDCCCTIEDVDKINFAHIYPRTKVLSEKIYFRYFKLKLYRDCPFWKDWSQCAIKDCSVDFCSKDEVPPGLKELKMHNNRSKYSKASNEEDGEDARPCAVGEEDALGNIDKTISDSQLESLHTWSQHDGDDKNYCVDLEEDSEEAEWVDLLLNPERYTGYTGFSAHRIWESIYKENCFLPGVKTYDDFKRSFLTKTCLEKRVFYRVVSGLHTSINIHLSYKYLLTARTFALKEMWGPNLNEFRRRFDPSTTNGKGPYWLKNLYFTYLIVLRAITKAAPYWKEVHFYTGDAKEDAKVKDLVIDLVNVTKTCPSTFDERIMFTGDPVSAAKLKEEFRLHFKNVTKIMDCVGCAKCRLWGKLQTTGIGTALKILFSSDKWDTIPRGFELSRTEVVAIFNTLARLADSMHILDEFRKMNESAKGTKGKR